MFSGAMIETKEYGAKYHEYVQQHSVNVVHHTTTLPHSYKRFAFAPGHFAKAAEFRKEA